MEFITRTYDWAIIFGSVLVGLGVALVGFIFLSAATLGMIGFVLGFIGECAKDYRKWKAKRMLNRIDKQMRTQGFAIIKAKDVPPHIKEKMKILKDAIDDKANVTSFDDIITKGLNKNNNGEKPN